MMYNTDVQIVLEAVIELVSVDMCPFTRVGDGAVPLEYLPFFGFPPHESHGGAGCKCDYTCA